MTQAAQQALRFVCVACYMRVHLARLAHLQRRLGICGQAMRRTMEIFSAWPRVAHKKLERVNTRRSDHPLCFGLQHLLKDH